MGILEQRREEVWIKVQREHKEWLKEKFFASSTIGQRFKNATFETTEKIKSESFLQALKMSKKYFLEFKDLEEKGIGLFYSGDYGTGKTHLAICIANGLIERLVEVKITSLMEIVKEIKSTFGNEALYGKKDEKEILEKLTQIRLLIIDDFGIERFTKGSDDTYNQEIIFDIINSRYNKKMPTIITSNFTLDELIQKGLWQRTADRINGMCIPITITNTKSYRNNELEQSIKSQKK